MRLEDSKEGVDAVNIHVCGVDKRVELVVFVPYLLLEDRLGSDHELVLCSEVCLVLVAEVRVAL